MDKDPERERSGIGRAMIVIAILVALPVLYVLSIGPVGLFVVETGMEADGVKAFYAPVVWLARNNATFGRLLKWYIDFWAAWPQIRL